MAITKNKKTEILQKLKELFANSKGVAFVNFHKLSVANSQELRNKLRSAGGGYFVAKKTLIKKSLKETSIEGSLPELEGEIGIAYLEKGDDATVPAREVFGFSKTIENALKIVGGIFDSRFIAKEEALAIASIPSRATLLAQFANLVNSPLQRFVVALSEISKIKK